MPNPGEVEVQAHLATLNEPNPSARLTAALALQKIGGYLDRTLPVLVNDIAAVDSDHVNAWQWTLKRIGRPAIVALADKALEADLPTESRLLALRTIACEFCEHHAAAANQMNILLSKEGLLGAWAAVILALAQYPIHAHDAFLNALRSDDSKLVERAVFSLHSFKGRPPEEVRKVKAAFLPCLVHSEEEIRRSCCLFVQIDLDDDDLHQLKLSAGDPIDAVISTLGKMEAPPASALNLLMRGLFSDDYDSRMTDAPAALLRLGAVAVQPLTDLALDAHQLAEVRCTALGVLARMGSLPTETMQRIRSILDESGQLPIYAGVVLARQGLVDETVIDRLVTGVEDDVRDAKGCLQRLPEQQTVPVLMARLKLADDERKMGLALLLAKLGWNSPVAAQAIVDEFASAADDTLRNMLANALREFDDLAVPPVLQALATYTRDEQIIWLMEGLEFVGPPAASALPILTPLLEHRNPDVAFCVAKAVAAIDRTQPGVIPPLLHALSAEESLRRYEAMNRLRVMGDAAAACVPRLIELLDDPEYRQHATSVLGGIGPAASEAIPRLAELTHITGDSSSAIDSLARMEHTDATAHLIAALDNDRNIRNVLRALVWSKSVARPAVPKLRAMLAGPYRVDVVKTLGSLGETADSAVPDLIALLDDDDRELRMEAITALGKLSAGGPQLLELAQDQDAAIRIKALESLGGPRPTAGIPLLMAAAESDDIKMAIAGFRGLSGYREDAPKEFVPLLLRRIDEGDETIKWAAAYALEQLGPTAAPSVPLFVRLLSDTDFREQAYRSLEAIGPASATALPELERLLTTHQDRLYARSAIWAIAPERARELKLPKPR